MVNFVGKLDELKLQKLIVTTVTDNMHGFAVKLAHRHLVGVPDLFVKVPMQPSAFVEVKQVTVNKAKDRYDLKVTYPQLAFLTNAAKAGTRCGVAVFVQMPTAFGMGVIPIDGVQTLDDMKLSHDDVVFLTPGHKKSGFVERVMWQFLEKKHDTPVY